MTLTHSGCDARLEGSPFEIRGAQQCRRQSCLFWAIVRGQGFRTHIYADQDTQAELLLHTIETL